MCSYGGWLAFSNKIVEKFVIIDKSERKSSIYLTYLTIQQDEKCPSFVPL